MATIAIGDIHGNFGPLEQLLRRIESELASADTVVFLGDYIDRGPSTRQCIDRILAFMASTPAAVIALLGNHEEWLLRSLRDHTRHSWLLGMEAFETIKSYSLDAAAALREGAQEAGMQLYRESIALPYDLLFDAMPPEHLRFLQGLQLYARTEDGVYSHAGCDPQEGGIEQQSPTSLVWGRPGFQSAYSGPDWLVYGHYHNVQRANDGRVEPVVIGRTIGIDSSREEALIALRLPDGAVFQGGTASSWTLHLDR